MMTVEEKEARLTEMMSCLKKRNIMRIRELLVENLQRHADDSMFLKDCYLMVKEDPLVFQKHNNEILDYKVKNWSEDMYPALLHDLKKNYSRKRYHLAMDLAMYFYEQHQDDVEEESDEALEIELKPKKKKKPKRVIPDEEKYKLTGIGTTSALLIGMVVQLLMAGE